MAFAPPKSGSASEEALKKMYVRSTMGNQRYNSAMRSQPVYGFGTATRAQALKSSIPPPGIESPGPAYTIVPAIGPQVDGRLKSLPRFSQGTATREQALKSNQSLVAKMGLVRRTQPLLIFAAGGGKPKQVPAASSGSAYAVTAWVKPQAEPQVFTVKTQQQLHAACGGRQMCLITQLEADSSVLMQLALKFRTVKVVSLDVDGGAKLSWGRGDEVRPTPAAARGAG